GYAEGEVSTRFQEDAEEIRVVLADKEEVRRILREEKVSMQCAYQLMHFLYEETPFGFLGETNRQA
ncbi:MAG: NUDIX hydrolase, partial [Lachnospiraceae bacterium]|nr:NUDIX hydrolase [Lachnospiraceae bacterium]